MSDTNLDTQKLMKFNFEKMNPEQTAIAYDQLKESASLERQKALLTVGGAILAATALAALAIVISQFAGALFVHVSNLDWGIMSSGTERVLYLGSATMAVGGGLAGALIYHLASQAFTKAKGHWNTANALEQHALQATFESKNFSRIDDIA